MRRVCSPHQSFMAAALLTPSHHATRPWLLTPTVHTHPSRPPLTPTVHAHCSQLEVHGSAAKQVAAMYSDYVAEQPYLDSVFIAHDVDGSTRIELGELMGFMQEITNGMGIDIGASA